MSDLAEVFSEGISPLNFMANLGVDQEDPPLNMLVLYIHA